VDDATPPSGGRVGPVGPVACGRCGRAGVPDLTWSLARDVRGERRLCPDCTRVHVRDIEARTDETWW